MGITTDIDEKVLSELKLLVKVGAKPIECVKALEGKMSRSSVYKYHNRFKIQAHHKAIDNAIEEKAVNISSEVVEELVSKNEQFKEESAHIINELSGKNEELQKELHTQKVVIETLQKGVNELNEAITESKIMIAEIAKERDDKDEEIRVLNLELQKYKNDIKMVIDDRRKLECLLADNVNTVELNPKYDRLYKVLLSAYNQASNGKGKERHQLNDDEPFENQKICEIARRLSVDYNLGQAVKKIYESKKLTNERDIAELYGAINYIAAAIIVKQEENNER